MPAALPHLVCSGGGGHQGGQNALVGGDEGGAGGRQVPLLRHPHSVALGQVCGHRHTNNILHQVKVKSGWELSDLELLINIFEMSDSS